jgi:cell division protein ZipA
MDTFRLILIFVGIAILVLIYAFEMRRRERRKPRKEPPFLRDREAAGGDRKPLDLNDLGSLRAQRDNPDTGHALLGREAPSGSAAGPASRPGGRPAHEQEPSHGIDTGAEVSSPAETASPPPPPISEGDDWAAEAQTELAPQAADRPVSAAEAKTAPPTYADTEAPAEPTAAAEPVSSTEQQAAVALPEVPVGMQEMIAALHVMAQPGELLAGDALLKALTEAGLEYGAMRIFHSLRGGRPLFSVANLVEPGSFDPSTMADSSTRGIVLFLRLPGPENGREAFNAMLHTAEQLAETLHGRLRDERRNPLTRQNIDLTRERIAEYEYKLEVARKRAAR